MYFRKLFLSCWFGLFILVGSKATTPSPMPVKVQFSIPYTDEFSPNSVIIPFTDIDGLIILQAKVNEEEGHFIFDTGANGLVLNDNYFKPDQLLSRREGRGLSGATSRVGVKNDNDFTLDELAFPDMEAQTIDLQHLEKQKHMRILGLIGYEVIQDFEIMFNYNRRFLTFSRLDKEGRILTPLPHTLRKIDSINFILGNHIPIVEVSIDGSKKKMGIDSGAEYNLLNIKRSKDIMANFKISKKINISGSGKRKVEALAGRLYRLTILERFKSAAMETVLTNLDDLEKIYNTRLDGILGYPFMAPWLMSINYKKRKIYFHKFEIGPP